MPKGPKASKFVHSWIGPLKIVELADYDNYLIEREDEENRGAQFTAHISFLVIYHYPTTLLKQAAADIEAQLEYESTVERKTHVPEAGEATRATTAPVQMATSARG